MRADRLNIDVGWRDAGPTTPVEGRATLAELHARLQGRRLAPRRAAVGF